ncbi:MAG TPA: DUF6524 family protein [Kiloniellales bacterium]|jgi:hypothetical protein|nr:DUF6524 family protein [Kiloniellales bacterium]
MEFGFWGWVVRWMLAMFIVLATYNPTGYSFWHWVVQSGLQNASVKVLAALILLLLHLIYLRATIRSIGPIGIGLITATLGAFAWWLSDLELIDMGNRVVVDLVLLVMFATLMSIGISWSHLRNRLSGQIDSDDVTTPPPV